VNFDRYQHPIQDIY